MKLLHPPTVEQKLDKATVIRVSTRLLGSKLPSKLGPYQIRSEEIEESHTETTLESWWIIIVA